MPTKTKKSKKKANNRLTGDFNPPINKKKFDTFIVSNLFVLNGAQGRIRTGTISLSVDFESTAATVTPLGHI